MTSARDLRAMVASLDKMMHQVRSVRGADCDVRIAELEEDVGNAAGLLQVAKRLGVDSSCLSQKMDATKKLLGKEDQLIEGAMSGNGRVVVQHPNTL